MAGQLPRAPPRAWAVCLLLLCVSQTHGYTDKDNKEAPTVIEEDLYKTLGLECKLKVECMEIDAKEISKAYRRCGRLFLSPFCRRGFRRVLLLS